MASLENERETATRDIPFRRIGPRTEPRMPEDLNTLTSPVPGQGVPWRRSSRLGRARGTSATAASELPCGRPTAPLWERPGGGATHVTEPWTVSKAEDRDHPRPHLQQGCGGKRQPSQGARKPPGEGCPGPIGSALARARMSPPQGQAPNGAVLARRTAGS